MRGNHDEAAVYDERCVKVRNSMDGLKYYAKLKLARIGTWFGVDRDTMEAAHRDLAELCVKHMPAADTNDGISANTRAAMALALSAMGAAV